MSPRRLHSLACVLIATLILATFLVPFAAFAQDTTLPPTAVPETPADASATPGTPAPTVTPAPTPTATPTLTALQTQLVLAQAYLEGHDFAHAVALFAAVAELDRGNPVALAGLKAALEGQAASQAGLGAPTPAPGATSEPAAQPASSETAPDTLRTKLFNYSSTVVAWLVVVMLVYLLAHAFRWLLYGLRELWLVRVRPLLHRPAVAPGFLIGEFINGLGADGVNVHGIVVQSLMEKLVQWNQLVHVREVPVEPAPLLDLGGMGWLRVLWNWILPPARGYKVTGMLLQSPTGAYELAIQRTALAHNRVDLSKTLEKRAASPEIAFRAMASEAAKWLVAPADMAAGGAVARGMRAMRGAGEAAVVLTPSEIFDQALEMLLPVRQQVSQGAIDFNFAREQLQGAEGLLSQLPDGSQLRADLQGVIADLRKSVPGG